ncbi:MAG: autotransporter outer membrane beta-barrel domain-containing protein [Elusimicrobia bacterium]|nr:autotransporter outer membrane beta-barrel domain-containing protein [Elusimicrobiota bacterium]
MRKQLIISSLGLCVLLSAAVVPAQAQQTLTIDGFSTTTANVYGNGPGANGSWNGADTAALLDSNGNTLNFLNSYAVSTDSINHLYIYGGAMPSGGTLTGDKAADNNTINIDNSNADVVTGGFAGSSSGSATANGNTVNATNSHVMAFYGGNAASSTANTVEGNTVNLSNCTVTGALSGGYAGGLVGAASATLSGNAVNVSGNSSVNSVTGAVVVTLLGTTGTYTLTNNTVTVMDSTVSSLIAGGDVGFTLSASANIPVNITNNTVTIGGVSNLSSASVYGGYLSLYSSTNTGATDLWTGNTLNVKNSGMSVAGVYNFENLNFYLPTTMAGGETMLTVGSAVDITNSKIGVAIDGGTSALNPGDTVTLINTSGNGLTTTGINTTALGIAGISKIYDFDLTWDADNLYATVAGSSSNDQTKALSEGQLGGLAFLNQGSDLIASYGIIRAMQAARGAEGITLFAAMDGGSAKYETGSHIDVKGFSMMAGLAKKMNENITAGAFLEAGWGNYDSYNTFNSAPSVDGGGNTNYYGLGLLGRYDIDGAWYGEGSVRAGSAGTDFSSADFVGLSNVSYDTSAMYYGAHLGAGWLHELSGKFGLDLSAKAFYTYQGGDDADIQGDAVSFDAANSIRTRLGGRVNYAAKKNLTPYAGAFLDYEFNGKAEAAVNGAAVDTPELKGATGVGELGLQAAPSDNLPLTLDIGLQGYAGTRQGFSASLQGRYMF